MLLSYEKGCIWVSSNEMDEPRTYYTEWSKSERERKILYINAYKQNLEGCHWWFYVQDSKGDTDVKRRLLDSVEEGEGRMTWENSTEICTLPYVKQMTSASLMHEVEHPKLVLWDNQEGWGRKEGRRGRRGGSGWGNTCTPMADSCQCLAKPPQYCKAISFQLKYIN